jgi:hypothetical protein
VQAPARGEAVRCQTAVLQDSSIVAAAGIVNTAAAAAISASASLAIETMPNTSTATAVDDSNTVQLVPVAAEASMNVSQQSVPAATGQQQISIAIRTGTAATVVPAAAATFVTDSMVDPMEVAVEAAHDQVGTDLQIFLTAL